MQKWEERTMRAFIWSFGLGALFVFLMGQAKGAALTGCKIDHENAYWKTYTFTEQPNGKRNYQPIAMDESFKKAASRCDKWLTKQSKKRKEKK